VPLISARDFHYGKADLLELPL